MCADRWMDKENVLYLYNGILFDLKKAGSPVICANKYGGHCAKWNTSHRERLNDIIYMWNLKNKSNSYK